MGLFTTMNSSVIFFLMFISIHIIFIIQKLLHTNSYFSGRFASNYRWVFKEDEVENPFLQTSQTWGFSPVCVRWCLFSKLGLSNVFEQTRQGNIVLVLALLLEVVVREFAGSKSWAGIIGLWIFSSVWVVFAEEQKVRRCFRKKKFKSYFCFSLVESDEQPIRSLQNSL